MLYRPSILNFFVKTTIWMVWLPYAAVLKYRRLMISVITTQRKFSCLIKVFLTNGLEQPDSL